ncbi:MAG: hypothetical protein LBJ23_00265, partial [Tannerella sp.]|nr:hypothetical protein [Tannerella sp.]
MMEQETNLSGGTEEIKNAPQAEHTQTSEIRQEVTAETVEDTDVREGNALLQKVPEEQDKTLIETDVPVADASEDAVCVLEPDTNDVPAVDSGVQATVASDGEENVSLQEIAEGQDEILVESGVPVADASEDAACVLESDTNDVPAADSGEQATVASDEEENIPLPEMNDVQEESMPSIADEPVLQELPTSPDNFCGDLQEA